MKSQTPPSGQSSGLQQTYKQFEIVYSQLDESHVSLVSRITITSNNIAKNRFNHSYYKNSYVTWAPGILSRHLVNGCVLKCSCVGLMVFRNLSCLGIYNMLYNVIGIIPAYACNVLNVCDAFVQILQPLANVHDTKWTRHVKRDCDVAVLIIAVV